VIKGNQEPRNKNQEPRSKNQETRDKSQEARGEMRDRDPRGRDSKLAPSFGEPRSWKQEMKKTTLKGLNCE
jgi:hypothetical protein